MLRLEPSFHFRNLDIVFLMPKREVGSFKFSPVTGRVEEGKENLKLRTLKVRKLSMERWDGTF